MTQATSHRLFRKQAIEHQSHRLHGDVVVLPKASTQLLTGLIAVWILAVMWWLASNTYIQQVTVRGWLKPSSGIAKSYAREIGGVIDNIWVTEGQYVFAGQALSDIKRERMLNTGDSLESRLINEYVTQQIQLQQQQQHTAAINTQQVNNHQQQVEFAKRDIQQLDIQLETLKKRASLLTQRIAKTEAIRVNGHITAVEIEHLEEQRLVLQSEVQRLQRARLTQLASVKSLMGELSLLTERSNRDQAKLAQQFSEIEQRKTELQSQLNYTLVATKTGTVSNLQVQPGQSIQQHQPLMSIVPVDTVIEANLLIPVRAAGFLTVGQTIDIRYDTFPYQKYGLYKGTVLTIADALLLPNEASHIPLQLAEPMYLVRASLERPNINAGGHTVELKPGMTFSADIAISERTLLEWLLAPIFSLKGRL